MQNKIYSDHKIIDADFSSTTLFDNSYERCTFTNCDFVECTLDSCNFDNCTFISCNLSILKIKDSTFRNVKFKNSKMVAINWSKASIPISIGFDNCIINNSSFYQLDLRKIGITDCTAKNVDFEGTNLQGAILYNTDFEGSSFIKTNLQFADFSTSKNYYIDPRNNNIRKAKFSIPEAFSFFAALGVDLVD